jgi:hypothetical protein
MTWQAEPMALSPFRITMTATTATEQSGVEYYFNNITDPCHDSGWQDSPVYEDVDLEPDTDYTYQVKARDKSLAQNETLYSITALARTNMQMALVQEDFNFVSIGGHDGRIWDDGYLNNSGYDPNAADAYALRLGDYSSDNAYKNILSFDTDFLPEDCVILSAKLVMTRSLETGKLGQDPFIWGGNCYIDVAGPYFGSSEALAYEDFDAPGDANQVAFFADGDPGEDMPMISTAFNSAGKAAINTNGLTQLRVYFEIGTNANRITDMICFYSGNYNYAPKRPNLEISYITRTRVVEAVSIAAHDGTVWDIDGSGVGGGSDFDDAGAVSLRLGDEALLQDKTYKVILSFDTNSIPEDKMIAETHLGMTRGNLANTDPFTWGGACNIDVANYFGSTEQLENQDFQAAATSDDVAVFSTEAGDPRPDGEMLSSGFSQAGLDSINTFGITQIRVSFENLTNGDNYTDYIGFYSGDSEFETKRPRLLIRYKDY